MHDRVAMVHCTVCMHCVGSLWGTAISLILLSASSELQLAMELAVPSVFACLLKQEAACASEVQPWPQ